MRADPLDELDSSWEEHKASLQGVRVCRRCPYSVSTSDVTEADVLETTLWAQQRAGADALYAVALVGPSPDGRVARGLTWLVSMDANDHPSDAVQRQTVGAQGASTTGGGLLGAGANDRRPMRARRGGGRPIDGPRWEIPALEPATPDGPHPGRRGGTRQVCAACPCAAVSRHSREPPEVASILLRAPAILRAGLRGVGNGR